jgi:hypothetical protein
MILYSITYHTHEYTRVLGKIYAALILMVYHVWNNDLSSTNLRSCDSLVLLV